MCAAPWTKELKKQIEPREQDIQDMKEQIKEMDHELERYHKAGPYTSHIFSLTEPLCLPQNPLKVSHFITQRYSG